MDGVFLGIGLVSLLLFIFGVFSGILWKGKRKRGWIIAVISLVVFSIVGTLTEEKNPSTTIVASTESITKTPAEDIPVTVVPDTDVSSQEIAQPVDAAQSITPDVVEPETQTPVSRSQSILETPEAFAAYCAWRNEGTAMAKRADELYGNDSDKWYAFYSEQDNLLSERLTQQIGVPSSDWLNYSIQHNWDQECKANASNWLSIDNPALKLADIDNARFAVLALKAGYEALTQGRYHDFLNAENFQTVKCVVIESDGYQFAGCRLFGQWSGGVRSSQAQIYWVAKTAYGVAVVPFTLEEVEILKVIENVVNHYSVSAGTYVGDYPIADIDPASIKAQFDNRL